MNHKKKNTNKLPELSSKAVKARFSLYAAHSEWEIIRSRLEMVSEGLSEIINSDTRIFIGKDKIVKTSPFEKETQRKRRTIIAGLPSRLEFIANDFRFYVDFTISPARGSGDQDMEGAIVYGANRTLCFYPCIFPKKSNAENCYRCERIGRCDGLEDRPLLKFLVNRHGAIKSDKFEDQWRLCWEKSEPKNKKKQNGERRKNEKKEWEENMKVLAEIHYRAIDKVWRDVLDWTNENLVPER